MDFNTFTQPYRRSTYHSEASPTFANIFLIDEAAYCRRTYGHEYHYDLAYIGEFEHEIPSENNEETGKYETLICTFELENYSSDKEGLTTMYAKIGDHLRESIIKHNDDYKDIDEDKLFFDSIPYMIYNTLKLYNSKQPTPLTETSCAIRPRL
jgi:hypothetical protein